MTSDNQAKKTRLAKAEIRRMEIDDLSAVYHLGEKLFTSEEFPILYRTWDAYEVTDHFTWDPEYCLVGEAGEEVVGFILATKIEKEGTAWKRYGYLSWIGVDENYQRTRLGRRLYKRLEEQFKADGIRMVIADTEETNNDALSFFRAMGFDVAREHIWLAKTLRRTSRKTAAAKETGSEDALNPEKAMHHVRKTHKRHPA